MSFDPSWTGPITITLLPRDGGGLRVYSDDLPGLILSHTDPAKVMADVLPAINEIVKYRAFDKRGL